MYKITEDLFMHLSLHFPLTSKDWYSYFNVGGLTSKLFSEKRLYTATLLYLNPYELSQEHLHKITALNFYTSYFKKIKTAGPKIT